MHHNSDKRYGSQRWRNKARLQMTTHPLCRLCLDHGTITAAAIADHIVPHKGNELAFWYGALQSLCASCHSSVKAIEEIRGYQPHIGNDGYPIDPNHPFNAHA